MREKGRQYFVLLNQVGQVVVVVGLGCLGAVCGQWLKVVMVLVVLVVVCTVTGLETYLRSWSCRSVPAIHKVLYRLWSV